MLLSYLITADRHAYMEHVDTHLVHLNTANTKKDAFIFLWIMTFICKEWRHLCMQCLMSNDSVYLYISSLFIACSVLYKQIAVLFTNFFCLYLSLSTVGIVSKRMHISSRFFDFLLGTSFFFLGLSAVIKFQGNSLNGASYTRGWGKFAILDRNRRFSRKRYTLWLLYGSLTGSHR